MPIIVGMTKPARFQVATRVRELRRDQRLTQAQLAEASGLDRHTVQNIEAAKNCTLDVLEATAEGLGVQLTDLFGD